MSEIPNDQIPKVESIYTKEDGWKQLTESAKQYAINAVNVAIAKDSYEGSVLAESSNNNNLAFGYKRIIFIEGIDGVPNFFVGKKQKRVMSTFWTQPKSKVKYFDLKDNFIEFDSIFRLGVLDITNKSEIDNYIKSYVKDKPEFYINMLDQLREQSITRESKRSTMAVIELAIEMGASGTSALLVEKNINPNTIPTGTGTTGTGTGTGSGTGSGTGGTGSTITANLPLVSLGLFAGWLILKDSDKK